MSATQILFCIAYLFVAGLLAYAVFKGDINISLPTIQFPSLPLDARFNHPKIQKAKSSSRIFYHGTTRENAEEILKTGLWMRGKSGPAIWMGDKISTVREYAGNDGAIVVVQVDPETSITPKGEGVWTFNLPNSKDAYQEYYSIDSIKPVKMLNYDGNPLSEE